MPTFMEVHYDSDAANKRCTYTPSHVIFTTPWGSFAIMPISETSKLRPLETNNIPKS